MNAPRPLRFAAVGLDHGHILDHIQGLLGAGCTFAGYCPESTVPELVTQVAQGWPQVPARPRAALGHRGS